MQNCKTAAKYFIILQFFFLQLPLDHLLQNLAKETEKLKEMAPHLSEEQDGQGTLSTLCKCFFNGATLPFVHLEKFAVKFSSLSFVIRVNLLHPLPSLFLFGLLLSLWCFSIFVNYYFQVSFNFKAILLVVKTTRNTMNELL